MLIAGLQKLTLLDFPGHCAATIFTPGCDLRCPFCHNASLVHDDSADEFAPAEIISFLEERKGRLSGLAITGGEPLMQNDIEDFMKAVKDIGYAVKLDTNGTFPDRLIHICESGLCDYVAVDLKNSWKNYPKTIGLSDEQATAVVKNIQRSVEYLKQGSVDFELRTTIVKELHDKDDVIEMAKVAGSAKYFLQMFVDSGDVLGNENQKGAYTAHSIDTMKEFFKLAKQYAPLVMLRGVD